VRWVRGKQWVWDTLALFSSLSFTLSLIPHPSTPSIFCMQGLLPGLASMLLSEAKLWNGGVLCFSDPVDIVQLSHVSKQYRLVHVSDPLWERWVAPIQEGTYLTRLAETQILTATRKTLMHAYMCATTGKCVHCGAWTAEFNVLVLLPQCYRCFSCWAQTGLLTKSKAKVRGGGVEGGREGRRDGEEERCLALFPSLIMQLLLLKVFPLMESHSLASSNIHPPSSFSSLPPPSPSPPHHRPSTC